VGERLRDRALRRECGHVSEGQSRRCYVADLDARAVLVEPAYVDLDYLSEFA